MKAYSKAKMSLKEPDSAGDVTWQRIGSLHGISLLICSDQTDLELALKDHWNSLGIVFIDQQSIPSITIKLLTDNAIEPNKFQNNTLEIDQGYVCISKTEIYFSSPLNEAAEITINSDRLIHIRASQNTLRERFDLLLSLALSALLRRQNRFTLHSSGLSNLKSNIKALLIGDSGSGKSTLTMRLAAQGWHYLSDDALILEMTDDKATVSPLRRVFALTEQTLNACGVKPTYKNTGDKYVIAPDELFPGGQIERMEPNHLVFPVIKPQATSELKPLTQSNAMMRLLHKSPWAVYDPVTGEAHLKVLSRLAQTTQAWELHAGRDLLEQPERASELLGNLGS